MFPYAFFCVADLSVQNAGSRLLSGGFFARFFSARSGNNLRYDQWG